MKKTLLILSIITLVFAGCKKFDEIEASKVEIVEERIERNDRITFNVTYSYPVVLEAVDVYIADNVNMTNAKSYSCNVEGKKFSVSIDNVNFEKIYYCYEYDNGYEKEKGGKKSMQTISKPVVVTKDITSITTTLATLNGSLTNSDAANKITEKGFCWGMEKEPTIEGNHYNNGGMSGTGTSDFSYNLTSLQDNVTYYVRAYANTNYGIVYGEEKSFTTIKVFEETVDTDGNSIMTLNGNVIFKMIAVEGGTFQMGATSEQGSDAFSDESPVHSVTLSDYYIGEMEVTQELWQAVMGSNPSYFSGSQKPVEKVSWNDCQEFITKLNNLTGKNFRLPTEAEWEYAARGGNKSKGYKYSGSNTIGNVAWYTENSGSKTHYVKTKQANELGIYDMSGNVWEWCQDWDGSYSSGSQTNPTGPTSGSRRVLRGGSWDLSARSCRVSNRNGGDPDYGFNSNGFRLILQELQ